MKRFNRWTAMAVLASAVVMSGVPAMAADETKPAGHARLKYLIEYPIHLQYLWEEGAGQRAPYGQLIYAVKEESMKLHYVDAKTGELVLHEAKGAVK